MRRHRTTARGVLLLLLGLGLAAAGGSATAQTPPKKGVPAKIIFPVVGPTSYTDDFGDPRPQGRHQGNVIMAPRKAAAVAVESGKVKFWKTSAAAGCMLYLYGDSGTRYLYIHLNNDLGPGNDNKGKCVAGVAYARGLKAGAHVQAGQQVGYVGDSGDANGVHPHLHFEVHPNGGAAVSPYPFLQKAQHLLFSAVNGTPFALTLTGTVVAPSPTKLQMTVTSLQAWPMNQKLSKLKQPLVLNVPATALVQSVAKIGGGVTSNLASLASARKGAQVVVWTQPALATLKAQRGDDGTLSAALIQLAP
jgi:hypothetical protein